MADVTSGLDSLSTSAPGAVIKSAPVKGGISVPGNNMLDATQTEALLANMQDLINQRSQPKNALAERLQDFQADILGKHEQRQAYKDQQAADLFNMRAQMAALRGSQAMQQNQARSLDYLMGGNPQLGQAQPAAVGRPSGPQVPDIVLRSMAAHRASGDPTGAQKVYDEWVKETTNAETNAQANAAGNTQQSYFIDGKLVQMTPNQFRALPPTQQAQATPAPAQPATKAPQSKYSNLITDKLLDSLRGVESSNDPFVVQKDTKAMGAYQHMPDTAAMLNKMGIKYNPFDEQQAREATRLYLTMLLDQNNGDLSKALAQYGGFKKQDSSGYVGKVLSGANVSVPAGAKPANKEEALANIDLLKKKGEADIETAKAEKEVAAKAAGTRQASMIDNANKSAHMIDAADAIINMASDPANAPAFAISKRGAFQDPRAAAASTLQAMTLGHVDEKKANDLVAKTLPPKLQAVRDEIDKHAADLGVDYAAQIFHGARMGIGLENMAQKTKGVGSEYLPETNKMHAEIIKQGALFNRARAELWDQYQQAHGKDASFADFEREPAYRQLEDSTRAILAKKYPQIFSVNDDRRVGESSDSDVKTTNSGVKYRVIPK